MLENINSKFIVLSHLNEWIICFNALCLLYLIVLLYKHSSPKPSISLTLPRVSVEKMLAQSRQKKLHIAKYLKNLSGKLLIRFTG